MKLLETPLKDLYVIEPVLLGDARGCFVNLHDQRVFEKAGIHTKFVRSALSFNSERGTLRGMHFQVAPHTEAKLVRCTAGVIFDVVVDLRPDSQTYKKWHGLELSAANRRQLLIPEGFAHGYLTLAENVEIHYEFSEFYSPEHYRGVRWNDPAFAIEWPLKPVNLAERDATYPLFTPN